MFAKILIANRGEIACRVIDTARKLGVKTVAVYSDADAQALHVKSADEAIHIGASPVRESYLDADKIIAAAKQTGAEAIHPGYGFLSENPDFVDTVTSAGLVFIGPSASAIRAMGLKDAAKALMQEAGVPVVPGYHGDNQETDFLAQQAEKIGYPVLIKARAGGGGKGMRRVDNPGEFADALAGAIREGEASFGDGHCLIEKYVAKPRHIEIQVFGDNHGEAVYLFERDCSLQRRHQKVIEEAPAPGMTPEMRQAMGEAAVKAAKAIGYSGAGTVEFIVDASNGLDADKFYFMEMNTRLQVEHPVTEAITGLDLVEWQLRVAAGEGLPRGQDQLAINGWAFEARIYAEDAAKGFLPATGTIAALRWPAGEARIDTGIGQGDTISPFYDPMIAKVITHGPSREIALAKMRCALERTLIAGTTANVGFLYQLCVHSGFTAGDVDTGLIGRDLDSLIQTPAPEPAVIGLAALSGLGLLDINAQKTFDPWTQPSGWRLWGEASMRQKLIHGEDVYELAIEQIAQDQFNLQLDDKRFTVEILNREDALISANIDGRQRQFSILSWENEIAVFAAANCFRFNRPDPLVDTGEAGAGGDHVCAPMPGLVKITHAREGKKVSKGDKLIILEAMKMEHALEAPRDGEIAKLHVEEGAQVSEGAILLELVPEEA